MKKFLTLFLTVAMLLSVSAMAVSAAGDFTPCGEQAINWDADAKDKITLDGKMSDWVDSGYASYDMDLTNMVYFDHIKGTMSDTFKITAYYAADADNLYVGFNVVDEEVIANKSSADQYATGDAIQIAIDFNCVAKDLIEKDPDYFNTIGASKESIFYSFAYVGDGKDVTIVRQNKNGTTPEPLDEASGAWGVCGKTASGWCAEIALSWQMLYDDFIFKSFVGDDYTAVINAQNPLKLGTFLCYMDANSKTNLAAAVCTFKDTSCKVTEGITPDKNGLTLTLGYEDGMSFTCPGMQVGNESGDDQPGSNLGKFDSLDKLSGFSESTAKNYFSGTNNGIVKTLVSANEDGSIHLVAADPAEGDMELLASVDIRYNAMVCNNYTGFPSGLSMKDKMEMVPNKNVDGDAYRVIVLKTKCDKTIRDQEPYLQYHCGTPNGINGTINYSVENQVWSTVASAGDEYTYFVFEMDAEMYENFGTDYINTLRLVWYYDLVYEDTVASDLTMDLYGLNLYKTVDEAVADLGLTLNEAPSDPGADTETDSETDSETESVTESITESVTESATESATETSEKKSGCGSVVGMSAAAVVLSAVAAAVVLKKKD